MVDPNPGRGMPIQLQRYWLTGKGAAKIRWGMPHDFDRCVRNLRKHFPKNPKGLCNILHQKALGAPPGKGHPGEMSLTAASEALMQIQDYGEMWAAPLAPINRPTSEPREARIFEHGALEYRTLPLPLAFRKVSTHQGHSGSVTVGRILGTTIGPDERGIETAYGWGDWLNEDIVPEVREARYLAQQGVVGISIDPGGPVVGTINPETGVAHMSKYTIGGATLVSIPAFTGMRLYDLGATGEWPDDDEDMILPGYDGDPDYDGSDCGCGSSDFSVEFAVMPNGWKGMPLAPREAVFDNDDAVRRITAWAAGSGQVDPKAMEKMFMWRDQRLPATDPTAYRLPYGDIISGRPTMVYHAIYAAAALLSGAHGGLPNIPDEDKNQIRGIISEIYPEMAKAFNDANIRAPWDRPANIQAREDAGVPAKEFAMTEATDLTYPPKSWFEKPNLTGPTPLTVTEEGQVYGHLALWDTCHRDVSMKECVLAPRSQKNYEPFRLGTVFTAEGEAVRVGKIVMDTRHASINLGYRSAAIHYDDTGDEVAVVVPYEDEFGVALAGAAVPEADPRKLAKLRRSPLSGDWRAVDGNLELTAALAVNVPAFPVFSMDGDERLALVAAGTVIYDDVLEFENLEEEFTVDNDDEAQEERAWELRQLDEDHEIWEQWNRAKRLYDFAVEAGMENLPPDPGGDPLYSDAAVLSRQMDASAPYHVTEDTGAGTVPTPTA